jgi:sulfur dioxygenase
MIQNMRMLTEILFLYNLFNRLNKSSAIAASMSHIESSYSLSNGGGGGRSQPQSLRHKRSTVSVHDERSIKSLDFESDSCHTINTNYDDYASEPVPAPKIRPTPPKKPLRLSLQRATSLQVVNIQQGDDSRFELFADHANSTASDKKRAIKRIHRNELMKSHSQSIKLDSKYSEKFV